MDRASSVRVTMYRKVKSFLETNSATLAINPAIGLVQNDLNVLLDQLLAQDVIASWKLKGYKKQKVSIRNALLEKTLQVGRALFAYWLNNNINPELNARHYSKRNIFRDTDGNLYMKATQLHGKADPVKALLMSYSCTAADVDMLLAKKEQFLAVVGEPKKNRKESGEARRKIGELLKQGTRLLQRLDNFMGVYESKNIILYDKYRTARALDQIGSKKKKKDEQPDEAPVQPGA